MNCEQIKQALPLYSGGELKGRESRRVRKHLSTCGSCRLELEKLNGIRSVSVDALSALQPESSDLWEELLYKLPKRDPAPERKVKPLVRYAIPVLAGCALILFLLLSRDLSRIENSDTIAAARVPVLEEVDMENVTVMTFQTDDPKITIVWIVEDEKI